MTELKVITRREDLPSEMLGHVNDCLFLKWVVKIL